MAKKGKIKNLLKKHLNKSKKRFALFLIASIFISTFFVSSVSKAAVITRVQTVSGSTIMAANATTSSVSATWPSATTAGNLLVAVFGVQGGTAISITPPTSWTLAARVDNGTNVTTAIYYIENASSQSGASTWSLSFASAKHDSVLTLIEYAGAQTSLVLDQIETAPTTGSSSTASSGTTATTAQANEVAVAGLSFKAGGGATLGAPTNSFTEVNQTSTGGAATSVKNGTEEKILSSTGTQNTSSTLTSGSTQWSGAIATFKAINDNPAPSTTGISPTSKTTSDPGFTLTVNGSNFISSSVVNFNGSARATAFVSAAQVTAAILTSDLTAAGTFNITVTNPTPGGGTSNNQTFTVNVPSPISTATALNTSGTPSVFGIAVTFSATVTPASGGAPSGTATFKDGAATIGTGTLNGANPGVATFSISTLSVAGSPHSITAVYGGDGTHSGSTSGAILQNVVAEPESPPSVPPTVPGAIPVEPVPEPIGPSPSVPAISPPLSAGIVGSPDTTTADLSILGGTTSLRPIKATPGDTTSPVIEIVKKPEGIIQDSIFRLSADTSDTQGVIEFLAYSVNGGKAWQPVTIANNSKIGQSRVSFLINSFALPDGNYEILLKAKDNSENESIINAGSVILDVEQPQIVSLLVRAGSLEIPSISPTEITLSAKFNFEIVGAFRGGVTQGKIMIGNKSFDFNYDPEKNIWISQINLETVGRQKAVVTLLDGANNKLEEKVFDFNVTEPLSLDTKDNQKITIFEFNYQNDAWQVYDAKAFQKNNPTGADSLANEGIVLPPGKYFIESRPAKNQNIVSKLLSDFSNVFTVNEATPLSGNVKNISNSKFGGNLGYSAEDTDKILDDIPPVKNQLSSWRGKDLILFNLDPRSYVALEQLAVMGEVKKAVPEIKIFATTNKYDFDYSSDLLRRGDYEIELISGDNNYFYKNVFEYRSPGFIFINRGGEIKIIRTGFQTKQEIINIIGRI